MSAAVMKLRHRGWAHPLRTACTPRALSEGVFAGQRPEVSSTTTS